MGKKVTHLGQEPALILIIILWVNYSQYAELIIFFSLSKKLLMIPIKKKKLLMMSSILQFCSGGCLVIKGNNRTGGQLQNGCVNEYKIWATVC